jgi:hypothetical protein
MSEATLALLILFHYWNTIQPRLKVSRGCRVEQGEATLGPTKTSPAFPIERKDHRPATRKRGEGLPER